MFELCVAADTVGYHGSPTDGVPADSTDGITYDMTNLVMYEASSEASEVGVGDADCVACVVCAVHLKARLRSFGCECVKHSHCTVWPT